MPGFEAMQRQQQAFLKSIMGGWSGGSAPEPETAPAQKSEIDEIKKQLAELQSKLSKI